MPLPILRRIAAGWLLAGGLASLLLPWHTSAFGWSAGYWLLGAPALLLLASMRRRRFTRPVPAACVPYA
ncbi:MAG TPA: hypothetical protein VFG73_07925 [Rhodanobacteraceae bacterium]|nr:hypothetical protein [Rhodanobacteraceae bacterium]